MALSRKRQNIVFILSAFLFLMVLFPLPLAASVLTLAWDPNNEDDLGGYKVYYGTRSMDYDFVIDVGNVTQYKLRGLKPETLYHLALTAYDISRNESEFSEEVSAIADEDPTPSPSASPMPIDSGGGGGCFIATAAYGSYLNPHVKILRDFRDEFLIPHEAGNKFVHLYYQFAPRIANHMEKNGLLRFLSRLALIPLIGMSSLTLKIATILTFLFPPLYLFPIFAITLRAYARQIR